MKTRIALCLLLGGLAAMILFWTRGLFPQHAALVGLAVAALAYSVLRVIDNARTASGHGTPRHQQERHDHEQMD